MCEESQSGRPILISKAKGERQNSWTVEIYKKKNMFPWNPGGYEDYRGVKSLNFKQKNFTGYQLVYEFIGQPKKSSTHNPFKDGFFSPGKKHERKSQGVPPRCASRAATNAPPYLCRIKGSRGVNPNKNWEKHQLTTEKIWRNMVNIWENIWKDGKRWEIH